MPLTLDTPALVATAQPVQALSDLQLRCRRSSLSSSGRDDSLSLGDQPSIRITEVDGVLFISCTGAYPVWLQETVERLEHLVTLEPGWDGRDARPLDPDAAKAALLLMARNARVNTPAAFIGPVADGSLQLEWSLAEVQIEVRVPRTGHAHVWYQDHKTSTEWEGTLGESPLALAAILAEIARRPEGA